MTNRVFLTVAIGIYVTATSQAFGSTVQQLLLDAGGGDTAQVDVDNLGFVTCTGDCATLVFPSFITPHTTLLVTGGIGQFTIGVTGVGGLDALSPTLQNLNQINAASTGAGTLSTFFTDTDYCLGGGACFGPFFVMSASTVNDTAIAGSTTTFAAFADAGNAIPAGTLIGSFSGLTGLSDNASGTFGNSVGTSGSLSTATVIDFTGAGRVQANLQLSSSNVPEPSTLAFFAIGIGMAAVKFRRKVRT